MNLKNLVILDKTQKHLFKIKFTSTHERYKSRRIAEDLVESRCKLKYVCIYLHAPSTHSFPLMRGIINMWFVRKCSPTQIFTEVFKANSAHYVSDAFLQCSKRCRSVACIVRQ